MNNHIDAFVVKSTAGEKDKFVTGAVRGNQNGKPRYDLIGHHMKKRLAVHLAKGAEHYGERNWEKGQNVSRTLASLMRHVEDYAYGDRSEDHLAAIEFNAMSIQHVEEEVLLGRLPASLLDIPFYADLPEFAAAFQRPTELEQVVLSHMQAVQKVADKSRSLQFFPADELHAATLPTIDRLSFSEIMLGLIRKSYVQAEVDDHEVYPDYVLAFAKEDFDKKQKLEFWDDPDFQTDFGESDDDIEGDDDSYGSQEEWGDTN